MFTVNRWATGDAWRPAEDIKAYAHCVLLGEDRGPARLVRFVNLVFRVFLAEIERLQDDKVAAVARYQLRHPARDPLEDRSLEILSRIDIDLRERRAAMMSPCHSTRPLDDRAL